MKDIFTTLSKYKITENVTPEENYHTEALAYVLKKNKKIAKILFEKICNNKFTLNPKKIKISTQKAIGHDSIIDLYINDHETELLIEIKLGAALNEYETEDHITINQLEKYAIRARNTHYKNTFIILLAYENYINSIKDKRFPENVFLSSWEEIFQAFKKYSNDGLIKMYLNYMKGKGMNKFDGFDSNIFRSIGFHEEDFLYKEDQIIKKQFEEFTSSVAYRLNKIDTTKWAFFNYPMDKARHRVYNHFFFKDKNPLNLNINTEINDAHLSIHIWLPVWKASASESKKDQGKIDQNSLYKKVFSYKHNHEELSKKLHNIFNAVSLTFDVSLNIKQYEHLKKSKKKAQGMQKGLASEIIKISKGSSLILGVRDKSLLTDNTKEVYDDLSTKTKFSSLNYDQIKSLVDQLFYKGKNTRNIRKYILIQKKLPIKYVIDQKEKIVEKTAAAILEFKQILVSINNL